MVSAEAVYQQKLKQGIYASPGAPSIGVNSSASDTAALLAASADLTVKPSYQRVVAKEAQTAALAAKKEPITAWSRDSVHPDAAAAGKHSKNSPVRSSNVSVSTGIPSMSGETLYKTANQKSASTMTSRTNPEKNVSRSGLATTSKASPHSSMDMGKITQLANKNSTKSLNARFNPDLDYRSGIQSELTKEEEQLASASAAASLKHGSSNAASSARRSNTFLAADVVDATLLAAASKKASERLNSLSSTTDFKQQAQLYANALAIAQKNSDERLKQHTSGVIDLGGGMTMLQSELDALASQIVAPVLSDIGVKAEARRGADEEHQAKQAQLAELHRKHKQEVVAQKSQEKADLEIAKQKRVAANEEAKKGEDEKLEEHKKEKNALLDEKKTSLAQLKEEHEKKRAELDAKKAENAQRIESEESALKKERKDELAKAQAEKDEEIAPTLAELETETAKLKEITDARDVLRNEVEAAEKQKKEYEDKIANLEKELAENEEETKRVEEELKKAEEDHERGSAELAQLKESAHASFEKHTADVKDLDEKTNQLKKDKESHLAKKESNKKEILDHIDEKVKDEHKINAELPEHSRVDVDEDKLRDTGSLFSTKTEEPVLEDVVPPKEEVKEKVKEEVKEKKKGLKRFSRLFKRDKKVERSASVATRATVESDVLEGGKNRGGLFKEEI